MAHEVANCHGAPATEFTDAILEQMKDAAFLLVKTGAERNVLTFTIPLIIGQNEINETVYALETILQNI